MTYKEKDILAMFIDLNSMFNELIRDYNNALDDIVKLKSEIDWYKKYTDKLVEHKDMVCLPADLKNLRESNAALATENEELKNKVMTVYKKRGEFRTKVIVLQYDIEKITNKIKYYTY